ncbi:hypothetical protein Veis_4746 [Verminephrobacter eiseniae EF01-2]|uniref:Uncharacterized protein n=1 Tax=Verminephrobacter eiseniae (strain EF01-2) TaxID=391735 RepID=A1WS34_VEREI|nr:hypothetical protein Veis_4746 [Verminephrobacter eiseniae EF01-2]
MKTSICCGNRAPEKYDPMPGVMETSPVSKNYAGGFGTDLMPKDPGLAQENAPAVRAATPLGGLARSLVSRHRSSVGLRWPSKRIAALHRLPIRSVWAARCALRCAPMAARSLRHLIGDATLAGHGALDFSSVLKRVQKAGGRPLDLIWSGLTGQADPASACRSMAHGGPAVLQ